jgi:hypothetical protein
MAKIHEIQGYVVVLDKVVHLTRVFKADKDQGMQFNVQLVGSARLQLKYPDLARATLERDLLIEALKAL